MNGVIDVRILQDRTVVVGMHSDDNGVDGAAVINGQQVLVVKVILQLGLLEEKTCTLNAIAQMIMMQHVLLRGGCDNLQH